MGIALYKTMKTEYAGKKEVHDLIVKLVQENSERMNKGIMCSSFNTCHLIGDMKKLGMSYPDGHLDCIDWMRNIGVGKLFKKLARQGYWIKGYENTAHKFHQKKLKGAFE